MDELPAYLTLKQGLNWVLFRNPSKLNVSTMVELLAFSDWVDTEDETVIMEHCENPLDSPIAIPGLSRSEAENVLCTHLQLHGAVALNTHTNLPVEIQPFEFAGCSIVHDLDDTHIRYETTFGRMEGVQIPSQLLMETCPKLSVPMIQSTNQGKLKARKKLIEEMTKSNSRVGTKHEWQIYMKEQFGTTRKQFFEAWKEAITETNSDWSKPGALKRFEN